MSNAAEVAEPRTRILISAYACGPDNGPEAGAGWAFARAAAAHHDVWVITRQRFRDTVDAALKSSPSLAAHLRVIYLDLPEAVMRYKRSQFDLYWYYILWQRTFHRRALELHAEFSFDVVHHVSFANDWLPCGAVGLGVPLVWGPVGGASRVPLRLLRWLGPRGILTELTRETFVAQLRRYWGDPAARAAAVVVAQNREVAQRFKYARRVVVEPNAAFEDELPPRTRRKSQDGLRRAVWVARLIPWKGPQLALAALTHGPAKSWRVDFYGEGPELGRLRKRVSKLGITDRVRFHGLRPRPEVLQAMAEADALLFPSLHDQAGWVAAEASSIGLPVVCFDLGGPPLLAGVNAQIASIDGNPAANLAEELAAAGQVDGIPNNRWAARRLSALVDDWYADAISAGVVKTRAPKPKNHNDQIKEEPKPSSL
ncbi:MAG: glycosyltransferase [Candidatus Saccharimonadales bacterium]